MNTLQDDRHDNYSEGYCPKCHNPLDISGVCAVCALNDLDDQYLLKALRRVHTCPICGISKTHHRLYGYRCSVNPEHDEMVAAMSEREIDEAFKKLEELK